MKFQSPSRAIAILDMPGLNLPPFPDDVPTVDLTVIDYSLLKAGDETETEKLWQAATVQGFW